MTRKIPTSLTLTPEQIMGLDAIAQRENRSRSWVACCAIESYLTPRADRPDGWTDEDEEESIRIAGEALAEGAGP